MTRGKSKIPQQSEIRERKTWAGQHRSPHKAVYWCNLCTSWELQTSTELYCLVGAGQTNCLKLTQASLISVCPKARNLCYKHWYWHWKKSPGWLSEDKLRARSGTDDVKTCAREWEKTPFPRCNSTWCHLLLLYSWKQWFQDSSITKIATLEWGEVWDTRPGILPEKRTARTGSCCPGHSRPGRNWLTW